MNEYVKREVILDPEVCKGINCEDCPFTEGPLCRLRTYILHTAPSADVPSAKHWTPVSEKLPEETGNYLTTTIYGEVYCDFWDSIKFNRTETVIAWMPMPEPYNGGEQK